MSNNVKTDKKMGWKYLSLALIMFGVIGLELVSLVFETIVLGSFASGMFTSGFRDIAVHWILTYILWGGGIFLTIRYVNRAGLNIFSDQPLSKKVIPFLVFWVVAILTIVVQNFGKQIDSIYELSNIYVHYVRMGERLGYALLPFVMQYIYYVFEIALVTLIIIFAQEAGENYFPQLKNIPWGGVFLGITWGLGHILSKDLVTGIALLFFGTMYGVLYLLLNKNVKYTYILVLILFII